jgi:SAM-dependent methyltransferase
LLGAGARVVAIEPDAALAAHLLDWADPQLEVRNIGFGPDVKGDGRFDLICAATSFHWLESGPALAQARRQLRPGGSFAMWWNVFHEAGEDPLFDALFEGLARPPSLISGQHYSLNAHARCAELGEAGLTDVAHEEFIRRVAMTPASLRALYATFSAVRQLPPAQREERLDAVEAMARRELGESFERLFRTPLYTARSPSRFG